MSEQKLCCNCLHCARWKKSTGIECHCDLDDRYLGYLQVMDEENDCQHWEKETKWNEQRDKQIREKMLEECVTPNEEVFEMCDEHYLKGRKDAIDEFVNTFIEEGKKIKYLRHIWIENTCKKIAEQLKGGAE